jgi:ribonuclease III
MRAELALLEAKLNYRFSTPPLLLRALTHSSAAREAHLAPYSPGEDNEQLEFLGDSILGFLITEALVQRHPECSEGQLSSLRAQLVSAAHLYYVARRLDLGSYLELGRGEEMSGGRAKKALLADALEAVIAAIYLDGGAVPARTFVAQQVLDSPLGEDGSERLATPVPIVNFKSALQELAQSRKMPTPRYFIVRERGPEHAKTFTVEVRLGKEWTGQAEGATKKIAAQRAARQVYERLLQES